MVNVFGPFLFECELKSELRMKYFFFRYYGWIAFAAVSVVVGLQLFDVVESSFQVTVTLITASLSFVYFAQKQKLEELRLFKDLFAEFNARYDELNEKLSTIAMKDSKSELTDHEKEDLVSYFNLCGEEFLYYKEGYIHPEVWSSWLNGMNYYYKMGNIRSFWDEELSTNSYYGIELG